MVEKVEEGRKITTKKNSEWQKRAREIRNETK